MLKEEFAECPNITGSMTSKQSADEKYQSGFEGGVNTSGCISVQSNSRIGIPDIGQNSEQVYAIEITASNSNALYGTSLTVQPAAVAVQYLIKY